MSSPHRRCLSARQLVVVGRCVAAYLLESYTSERAGLHLLLEGNRDPNIGTLALPNRMPSKFWSTN